MKKRMDRRKELYSSMMVSLSVLSTIGIASITPRTTPSETIRETQTEQVLEEPIPEIVMVKDTLVKLESEAEQTEESTEYTITGTQDTTRNIPNVNYVVGISEVDYKNFTYIPGIPLSEELQLYTYTLAAEYDINQYEPELYYYVLALMGQESCYNPIATSLKDGRDHGLGQIRDINFEELNAVFGDEFDVYNERNNISAIFYLLSGAYGKYYESSGISCVLMCYNMGESGAKAYWDKGIYSTEYTRKITEEARKIKELGKEYVFGC